MKKDISGAEIINGIKTDQTPELPSSSPTVDTFTFTSDDTNVQTKTIAVSKDSTSSSETKYYAVIEGKDYEMTIANGIVNISRTPTTGGSNTGATLILKEPVITGDDIAVVTLSGNSIVITKKTGVATGTAIITITGTINGTDYTKYVKVSIKSYVSNDSKVGYYADLNGDGKITPEDDGIIFADLYNGASGSALGVSYSLSAMTSGLKKYEESTSTYAGKFGTQKWIKVADGTTGRNRFYVMALKNVDTNLHYWYYNANNYSGKTIITINGIGIDADNKSVGRKNTEAIMTVYNKAPGDGGWGLKVGSSVYTDVFDVIKTKYDSSIGWFVPSRDEWAVFAGTTINKKNVRENYDYFGLSNKYWSSSQVRGEKNHAYSACFRDNTLYYSEMAFLGPYVRLCATF